MSAALMTREAEEMREQRDLLMEALRSIAAFAPGNGDVCEIIAKRARSAIAKVEAAS
jgi:hypothetical protein